ncbi:MAG TPA: radical SAM protein [Chitinophagaceae bacterium]|nr:radical SAM protein [Chitinophagaceae bacterium]
MMIQSLYRTYNRYRTLQTDKISSLPIVILMPHSSCNCRCVMCDIWKGNHNLKQLNEADISGLLEALKKYETQQVLMSGGEALLNPNFFRFCEILKQQKIKISLLSTGLTIKKNTPQLVKWVDDIIVSLDGDGALHDEIRNIPGAYQKLKEGIEAIRSINPHFRITGRTVIHRLNFRHWPAIINSAKELGLNRISFLPADVSSNAFNRETAWGEERQQEIRLSENELEELQAVIHKILVDCNNDFVTGFIAESPLKIKMLYDYYAAYYDHCEFPYKKCNAPWVSTVIEADGTVRPCFFHNAYGNIKSASLDKIINSESAIAFRKNLDMDKDETCLKCVCSLNLQPFAKI